MKSIQVKRKFTFFVLMFFVLSIFAVTFVIAESGSGSDGDSDSDSNSSGSNDSSNSTDDKDDDSDESDSDDDSDREKENKSDDNKFKEETREIIIDDEGREVEVRTKTKIKGDIVKIEVKRIFINEDGNKVVIKEKTEIKNGKEKITYSIKVKGAEVDTKLDIKIDIKNNISKIKAKLSTGEDQEIITTPDEALQIALDELRTTNNLSFELKEVSDGKKLKAVFVAKARGSGKLFGIFNTDFDIETLIDTDTGEIIKTNRPWWAFLIRGQDKVNMCHVSEEDGKKITINIAIPAVKAHLAHGDTAGECVASVCGDGVVDEGEVCDGDVLNCTTDDGWYIGTETCNATCDGFDICATGEFCGDGTINGNEACDDGNVIDGDGCDSLCQEEVVNGGNGAV